MDGVVKSPCGIKYRTSDNIEDTWCEYDKVIAKIHLSRYGLTIIDTYGLPIDNELDLEDIETQL